MSLLLLGYLALGAAALLCALLGAALPLLAALAAGLLVGLAAGLSLAQLCALPLLAAALAVWKGGRP